MKEIYDAIKQNHDAITQQLNIERTSQEISVAPMSIEKQLYANGFKRQGFWNNRCYYSKKGFEIVEHCGEIYRYKDGYLSGYGKPMNIDELNIEYDRWAESRKRYLLHELNKLK